MDLSLELNLGKRFRKVPPLGFKVLQPARMNLLTTGSDTITLNASNTDSYAVTNLPTWCTLNALTGEIVATADGFVSGRLRLDVVLTNGDGDTTITNGLVISIHKPHASVVNDDVASLASAVFTAEQNAIRSATHDTSGMATKICQAPNGHWHALDWYSPNQGGGSDQQLVKLNMQTNVLTIDTPKTPNVLTNLIPVKQADNGATYFHAFTTAGATTIMKYNPATETVNEFVASELATLTQSVNYKPMCLDPYDRKLYCVSSSQLDNQQGLVYSLDPATDTFASVKQLATYNTDSKVDCHSIASDNTYIYVSVGRQPNWSLVAIAKSDGTETVIATEASTSFLSIKQYRGGAVATFTSLTGDLSWTDHYLFNGAVSGRVDTVAQPWTSIDAVAETEGTELRLDKPTFDNALHDPDENGNITVQYKYEGETPFRSASGSIIIYDDYTKGALQLPNGDIFITGRAYAGFGRVDANNTTLTQYPRLGVSPCPSFLHSNGKIYISGYPSAATYEYDTTQAWSATNPKFIDYFDTISNSHKTRCMMEDKNGYLWIAGHMMRDGTGGGVEWWHPSTLDHNGVQGALIDGIIYNGCSVGQGQYICLSSAGTNLNTDGAVFIINADTKAITEVTPSTGRYDSYAGDIVSFNGTDNLFYGINTNLAKTECDIYCYNASTLAQVWKHTIPSSNETYTLLNRDDYQKLITSTDGYLYTVIQSGSKFVLLRIDPKSGGIEALSSRAEGYRITDIMGGSFFVENVVSKKYSFQTDAEFLGNMPYVEVYPLSAADVFIDMETKISQFKLMNRGQNLTRTYDAYAKGLVADTQGDWDITTEMSANMLTTYDYSGVGILHHVGSGENITWSVTWDAEDKINNYLDQIAGYPAEFGGFEFALVRTSNVDGLQYGIKLNGVITDLPVTAVGKHHLCVTFDRVANVVRYSLDGAAFVESANLIGDNSGWVFGIGNLFVGSTELQLAVASTRGSNKVGGVRLYLNNEFKLQSAFDADYAEAKAVYTTLLP